MAARKAPPNHAVERIEFGRDAALKIQETADRALLDAESRAYDGADPWRIAAQLSSALGLISRKAGAIVRTLEDIEGIDTPPDDSAIRLVGRRG